MMAIKIAMIPHLVELSGAPITHLEYAIRLDATEDFDVTFVVPGEGPLTDRARKAGLCVEVVENPPGGVAEQHGLLGKAKHLFKRREAKNRLEEWCTANKPDLLYASSVVNILPALAAKAAGIPLAYHLQEPPFSFPDTPANRKKVSTIIEAAGLLFIAPGSNDALFDGINKVPVQNAVELSRYDQNRKSECRATILSEHQLNSEAILVTFVGSITQRKGVHFLWEAAYDLFFRHPRLVILLVGPEDAQPEFVAELKAEAAESDFGDRFIFLGPRDDVPELLLGSDIFVLPTQAEAQPLALLEALAAGLPCVTTDVGDIPSVLLEGEIGFILPAEDPNSLQVGIEKVLDVPEVRKRYSEGALKRAQDFSYDKAVEIIAEELKVLLATT